MLGCYNLLLLFPSLYELWDEFKGGPFTIVDAWSVLSSGTDIDGNKSFMVMVLKELSAFC